MYLIQQITDAAFQKQNLILPDGTSLFLTIKFVPMQYTWIISELVYQSFILQGVQITNSPNILFQFQNQIPFGLACYSVQNREPSLQEDFASGASKLYILSQAEVIAYSEIIRNA